MKIILLILFFLPSLVASAQSDGNFLGARVYHDAPQKPLTPEQEQQKRANHIYWLMKGHVFRKLNGKIYNLVQDVRWWLEVNGRVFSKEGNVLILIQENNRSSFDHYIAVTNYSGNEVTREFVSTMAVRFGNYDMGGSPIELYDCGFPLSPAEESQKQIEIETARAQGKQKLVEIAEKQRQESGRKTFEFYNEKAIKNDGFAQLQLGELYLRGKGVETNAELARKWLSTALTNGYPEATNLLSEIETNICLKNSVRESQP